MMTIATYGSTLYREMTAFRDACLRRPLGLVQTEADLVGEDRQIHIALIENGAVQGTVLLKMGEGGAVKLRQMAIAPALRGRGAGRRLVTFAEGVARDQGGTRITLHARVSARSFYERLGYRDFGSEFTEVNLPHIAMARDI